MDYYGFQPSLYQLKFKSRGDSALSQRVVELFKKARRKSDIPASRNANEAFVGGTVGPNDP